MTIIKGTVPRFVLVVGLDVSSAADSILADAVGNVRDGPYAEVHLVHSIDVAGEWSVMESLMRPAREYLSRMGQQAREGCGARVTTHLAAGPPWRQILQTATNVHADLIVVGTHGRSGIAHLLLGSQAELVVRSAACPVLVVRPKDYTAAKVVEIEAACPACLEVQAETRGERLWCARHSDHHPRPHVHYEFPEPFGRGSMLLQPE